jgi:hypothetical protein
MTLCIAAHSHFAGKPRLALCFDSLLGNEYSVSEAGFKCDLNFAHGLTALWAGVVDHVEDAIPILKARFATKRSRLDDCKEELWVGMKEVKEALSRRGVKRPEVYLIVAGFIENEARIIYVGPDGVAADPSYRAIGSGAPSAEAMLRWRHLTQHFPLYDSLYCLYEAKKFGETSPFVGEMTTMFVLAPNADSSFTLQAVVLKGLSFLDERFNLYGPQRIPYQKDLFPAEGLI